MNQTIDLALGLPVADRGQAVTVLAEDQWFDRKSILIKAKDLARHLIAFGNAEGGTLVLGIQHKIVQGIARHVAQVNAIRQAPFDLTQPPVRARFSEVDCVRPDGEGDRLLVIRIDPGERVHESVDGACYLRVGDESRHLTFDQRRELEYDRGQSQYDGMATPGVTPRHLNRSSVLAYGARIGVDSDVRRVLAARSLLTLDGLLTNAAYLLFDDHPQVLFPQAYVRVVRFLAVERGTGARQELQEGGDTRIEGPIPDVIDRAQETIEDLVPVRRALASSGRFEATPIVPRDAWLEGLVNAVTHRSYSLAGDHIRVEIYPNRIEIESPGRFPGLADAANPLTIGRFARNPRIARVCADLRYGQELGEGIRRMFEEMRRIGLSDPKYRQTSGSVRLILTSEPRLDPRLAALLPKGSQDVIDLLRASNIPIGTGEIAEALGLSRPVVIRRLRALEQAGLVQWRGKSQKDPRAVWALGDL